MRETINDSIVSSLEEGELGQSVVDNTRVDIEHGSMTEPVFLTEKLLSSHLVSRRFGVEETRRKMV